MTINNIRKELAYCCVPYMYAIKIRVPAMQILAASDLAAGAEVRNCYGELSSCELVVKYGFALEADNPFDNVSVEPDSLTAAAQRHLGKAAARKRVAFLNAHR